MNLISSIFSQITQREPRSVTKTQALIALLLIAPIPTIGVWFAAFGNNAELGAQLWAAAKIWMVLGPVCVWSLVQSQSIVLPKWTANGVKAGLLSGFAMMAIIVIGYTLVGRSRIDFSPLEALLLEAGVDSKWKYFSLAIYLTLLNSLIEEYVFRWFMFMQLKRLMPALVAVFVSAAIFTIHHSVVLHAYIPWHFNILASLGVFGGGLIWSYLYYRYGRIWPAYLSHIGADIGVFIIGYDALF